MTMNDLTINISSLDIETLLSDWEWLIGKEKFAVLVTAMGDAFIEDINNGKIHLLDVDEAELIEVASSIEDFQKLLEDKDFVLNYFPVTFIGDILETGLKLKEGEVYSLKTPTVLSGTYELDNIESVNAEVHFSIAGQIHQQVQDISENTLIEKVEIG